MSPYEILNKHRLSGWFNCTVNSYPTVWAACCRYKHPEKGERIFIICKRKEESGEYIDGWCTYDPIQAVKNVKLNGKCDQALTQMIMSALCEFRDNLYSIDQFFNLLNSTK